jgi:outer membrane receptor protein involved in Fe transport
MSTSPTVGYYESVYLQDDYMIFKPLVLNAGLRFDATQFIFAGLSPTDSLLQPRLGLNYMVTETTKLHVFYGKLFQAAPVENLRVTSQIGGVLAPYDLKAEKDDYYEAGIAQQIFDKQVLSLNAYYRDAKNVVDEHQLLRTAIAQPFNFSTGYGYGLEFSFKGKITEDWSEYFNYSYTVAMGANGSGGILPSGALNNSTYQTLDHVQDHTANFGVTYAKNDLTWTGQIFYGSGLRTGPNNSLNLPVHFSMDTTAGYNFHGDSWWTRFRLSADVLNVLNNVYPITVANGFSGSQYAGGRQFFLRISKEL